MRVLPIVALLAAAVAAEPVTRADLARTLLRFEEALERHPPAGDRVREVNAAFDAATMAFFSGNFPAVLRGIDEVTDSLERSPAAGLRVDIRPRIAVADNPDGVTARVVPLYGAAPDKPRFRLGTLGEFSPGEIFPGGKKLPSGSYEISLGGAAAGVWQVLDRSPAAIAAENVARLDRVKGFEEAVAACRRRNAKIGALSEQDPADSFLLLADANRLVAEVAAEVAALEEGRDPYTGRTGDLWSTVEVQGMVVPFRLYAPSAGDPAQPFPLVIALHGAGADENMFFEAYGRGRLRRLAEERRFLLLSPSSTALGTTPAVFDLLLETMARRYPVDRRRIYLLGHSLGGMIASHFAEARKEVLAGVACIAGAGATLTSTSAPVLLIAGEIDPIVPASRLENIARLARTGECPLEFRVKSGYGHTLLVDAVLPEVVDWLLARERR